MSPIFPVIYIWFVWSISLNFINTCSSCPLDEISAKFLYMYTVAQGSLSVCYLLCNIQSLSLSLCFSCDQHLLRTLAIKLKLNFCKLSESVYSLSTRKFISGFCFNSCINCTIFWLYRNLQLQSAALLLYTLSDCSPQTQWCCICNLTMWPLCAIYTMLLLMQLASPEILQQNYLRPGQVG